MCCVILPYHDVQEKTCSHTSVSTEMKDRQVYVHSGHVTNIACHFQFLKSTGVTVSLAPFVNMPTGSAACPPQC